MASSNFQSRIKGVSRGKVARRKEKSSKNISIKVRDIYSWHLWKFLVIVWLLFFFMKSCHQESDILSKTKKLKIFRQGQGHGKELPRWSFWQIFQFYMSNFNLKNLNIVHKFISVSEEWGIGRLNSNFTIEDPAWEGTSDSWKRAKGQTHGLWDSVSTCFKVILEGTLACISIHSPDTLTERKV